MNTSSPLIAGTVIVVDDDVDVRTAARLLLKRQFRQVITVASPHELWSILPGEEPVAILLDMNFANGQAQGSQGLDCLAKIRQRDSQVAIVLATAFGDVELAVEAMKRGATDFVLKPWHNEKLIATLVSASHLCLSQREAENLRARNRELEATQGGTKSPMIGGCAVMARLERLIDKAAPTEANLLILGENGTGKELVAREVHRRSLRAQGPLVAVDLGALPESLFESELFGHVKGAFTGANTARQGRFVAAHRGTIFLDEIGNLPLHLQAKLLTVLEQRQVVALGADRPVAIDVRVIAATNLPRNQLIDESKFRPDLLYRLNTVELLVPPLRERREDIAALAVHFVALFATKYEREMPRIDPQAIRELEKCAWPGNVRALRHTIERAVIMAENGVISSDDLDLPPTSVSAQPSSPSETLDLETLERTAIVRAMQTCSGNISHMAKALGLTRAALYRRMQKHGIE